MIRRTATTRVLIPLLVVVSITAVLPGLVVWDDSGQPGAALDDCRSRANPCDGGLDAACGQTGAWLARQLGKQCRVIVRTPLVLGGDLSKQELDRWHRECLAPASRSMAACYFPNRPNEPITVLLFAGSVSYRAHAKRLFGEEEISDCGYYRPHLRTVIVNAGRGNGPALHELTHALMAFDFPDAPDWFSEGLASLNEQSRISADGRAIEGQVGRRLSTVQAAIRRDRLATLESLIQTSDFHGPREKIN